MGYKIAVGAGHGYNTPGKRTPDGEREWSFNNKVVIAFENEMQKYEGVELLRTDDPTGKTDVPLSTRTDKANDWGADIYISFHHNALNGKWGNHTGTETYYYKTSSKGKKLAKLVQNAAVKAYGLGDRGLKTNNLHITRETRCPAVLVEGGFMDSRTDIKKLRDDKVLENVGKYVAQAVAGYANLKRKEIKEEDTYTVKKGDTLWGISQEYGTTVSELKKANNLKSDLINIGQTLKIPGEVKEDKKTSKKKANLKVDGYWGGETTKALQRYFGTVVDGKISKPSLVIKEIQKVVGAKVDGYLGPETITKMQKHLGTPVDGKISKPSLMVKEMQRRLNQGKF